MHEDLMRPECHGGRNLHLRSEPVLDLMGKRSSSLRGLSRRTEASKEAAAQTTSPSSGTSSTPRAGTSRCATACWVSRSRTSRTRSGCSEPGTSVSTVQAPSARRLTRTDSLRADYEEEWFGTTHDGLLPMLEFKVSWYISDHTVAGHGMTLVVPASSNAPSRIHSRRRGV